MENRWNDAEAGGTPFADLLYVSRLIGADGGLVLWGGGNTSLKVTERDYRGRETAVLRVKGSGSDLKSIEPKHFPGVRMDDALALLDRAAMSDEEMVAYLEHTLMEPSSPRPSIETLLHAFVPDACVLHSHADAICALTNTGRGVDAVREALGTRVAIVPYRRPGFTLSQEVGRARAERPGIQGVVLMNHGLVTWADSAREAYDVHIDLVRAAEEYAAARQRGRRSLGTSPLAPQSTFGRHSALKGEGNDGGAVSSEDGDAAFQTGAREAEEHEATAVASGTRGVALGREERERVAAAFGPALRGLLGSEKRVVLRYDDGDDVLAFLARRDARDLSQRGPATPDHLLNTKRLPLFVDGADPRDPASLAAAARTALDAYRADYLAYVARHNSAGYPPLESTPRVILVPGLGMFTAGADARRARIAAEIYHHTIAIIEAAEAIGGYQTLSEADAFDAEYWPLELYKLTLLPPEQELARRIALVTGAGSGIGRTIATRFAEAGAHVVVTDVDGGAAERVAEEIRAARGAERAIGLPLDVTDEQAVDDAFARAALTYGGIDILVSNAGIALPAAIHELDLAGWQRSLDVNATGHFLVARAAVRLLRRQGTGGSLVFNASKNVPAPGKDFGAYSAAKAAETQLARVLAIENGEEGIRVNVLHPDAVFRGTNLWSPEVRAQRARAHGIAVEEIEEFYRKRNMLQVAVTPELVAEAALFFASDRSAATTGATLAVDGGVREAFPR